MSVSALLAALSSTWSGLSDACAGLSEAEWHLPTDLPGWTVKDNVSHLVGVERLLLGEPFPTHVLPDDLPHVRSEAGRFMEVAVDLRRSLPGAEVLDEFRSVTATRLAALGSATSLDEETGWFGGRRRPLGDVLSNRVFDSWAHEQDVRRAVRRPGGLDSPAAHVSWEWMLRGLSRLAEDVPAAEGRSMLVTTTGALELASAVSFGAVPLDAEPDVRVVVDWETFVRIVCGRVAYDSVAATVALSGDVELGEELLRNAAVTP